MTSRRKFLAAGAAMMAGAALPSIARAIPLTAAARRSTPSAWLPEPPPAELFQRLAIVAMDAAKAAGAEFADIRIGVLRRINVPTLPFNPAAGMTVGYGIRARVRGTWGFQHGSIMTTDAVTAAARSAAAGATRYAAANARLKQDVTSELSPAPALRSEWRGPMEIDPFTVAIDDYHRVMGTITETTARVYQNTGIGSGALSWTSELRVFASTEGALLTQHFTRGGAGVAGSAGLPDNPIDRVAIDLPGLESRSAGFESVLDPRLPDYLLSGIDEAVRLRELPNRRFMDVGRFPVVFEGAAFANLLGMTLSRALDGDRVSGAEADASGTTFLVPPEEIFASANPTFAKLLTVSAHRKLPSITAAGWDDEGVEPMEYTVVENGRVVDYHMSRETAPMIADWHRKRGVPVRSRGTVVASSPGSLPVISGGHLQVKPATARASVWDLAKEMSHGFVVRSGRAETEPGLTAGTFNGQMIVEIENGKPVARTSVFIRFATRGLLSTNLLAIGDASTVRTATAANGKGMPWQGVTQLADAPAALCKDVDIISWTYRP